MVNNIYSYLLRGQIGCEKKLKQIIKWSRIILSGYIIYESWWIRTHDIFIYHDEYVSSVKKITFEFIYGNTDILKCGYYFHMICLRQKKTFEFTHENADALGFFCTWTDYLKKFF